MTAVTLLCSSWLYNRDSCYLGSLETILTCGFFSWMLKNQHLFLSSPIFVSKCCYYFGLGAAGHVGLGAGGGALALSFTAMILGRSLNLSEPLIPSL